MEYNDQDLAMETLGWSPSDAIPYFILPFSDSGPLRIQDIVQFSISTHRERFPVSRLANVEPVGYTHGPLTVAGSLTLQEFDYIPLYDARSSLQTKVGYNRLPRLDEFPPIDILVVLVNEDGNTAEMLVSSAQFMDEGYSTSTEQGITFITYSYVARDYRFAVEKNADIKASTATLTAYTEAATPMGKVSFTAEELETLNG